MKSDRFEQIAKEARVRALTVDEVEELRGAAVDDEPTGDETEQPAGEDGAGAKTE